MEVIVIRKALVGIGLLVAVSLWATPSAGAVTVEEFTAELGNVEFGAPEREWIGDGVLHIRGSPHGDGERGNRRNRGGGRELRGRSCHRPELHVLRFLRPHEVGGDVGARLSGIESGSERGLYVVGVTPPGFVEDVSLTTNLEPARGLAITVDVGETSAPTSSSPSRTFANTSCYGVESAAPSTSILTSSEPRTCSGATRSQLS